MKISLSDSNIYSNSFCGRCVQIRDSQWVCHKINSEFPHFSSTRFRPFVAKKMSEFYPKLVPNESTDIFYILDSLRISQSDLDNLNFFKSLQLKLFRKIFFPKKNNDFIKILAKFKDNANDISKKRDELYSDSQNQILPAIKMLKDYKMGIVPKMQLWLSLL